MCFENMPENSLHFLAYETHICNRCFSKFKPILQRFSVQKVDILYLYNYDEVVKENLYKLKGCFDIELASIFLDYYRYYFKLIFLGYTIIPAPSFNDADEERGFNHVIEIFKILGLPILQCIHKTKNMKQSDLSKSERGKIKEVLKIDNVDLSKKKILIVDDVYTTGSTFAAMIELVRSKCPKKIKGLLMSKTIDLNMRDS